MSEILLSAEEVKAIAAGLEQPQRQVDELRRQGFWRARLDRGHKVILERANVALRQRVQRLEQENEKLTLATENERYDCPIHGLQDGPDCARC